MSRIGYDADTERYTFQDEQGVLYESEPGNAYGMLRPIVRDVGDVSKVRPNAFESESEYMLSFVSILSTYPLLFKLPGALGSFVERLWLL